MPKLIEIKGIRVILNTEIMERDIAELELEGKVGKIVNGTFVAPRPDRNGLLVCMWDNRHYDPQQIENVCMRVCPHYTAGEKPADDILHLDNCRHILFEGTSLDGKTPYMQKIEHQ